MIETNNKLNNFQEYKPSNRSGDSDISKLDWNECNLQSNDYFYELLSKSLHKVNYSEYPDINNEGLLTKLALYCGVDKKNVQTFNGSDFALHYIFACFLNKDTRVLIYNPNYTQVDTYVRLYSDAINYSDIIDPFRDHAYNFNDIENNDVIYISNPNNPTGYCINPPAIKDLLEKYTDKLFVIDEAYFEFSGKSCAKFVKEHKNLIVTRTFSKGFSLASIRLGYICASEELISVINKIRNTKEVNSFAQILGEVALDNIEQTEKRIKKIKENKEKLEFLLDENNIQYIKSEANFVLLKVSDSQKIVEDLANQKILVRDRSIFSGFENTIRVTIGDWDLMEKVVKTILKYR
jgi:histidinol-phosphate aminotransferase